MEFLNYDLGWKVWHFLIFMFLISLSGAIKGARKAFKKIRERENKETSVK